LYWDNSQGARESILLRKENEGECKRNPIVRGFKKMKSKLNSICKRNKGRKRATRKLKKLGQEGKFPEVGILGFVTYIHKPIRQGPKTDDGNMNVLLWKNGNSKWGKSKGGCLNLENLGRNPQKKKRTKKL